jgi:hypothetical protein
MKPRLGLLALIRVDGVVEHMNGLCGCMDG